MKGHAWKTYAFWIIFTEAVGALSGWLTRTATQAYSTTITRPPFAPPGFIFPIVWSILFALMGIGAARVYLSPDSPERTKGLLIYLVQLAVNFFWSIIFFNWQQFGFAALWLLLLWVLVASMILTFRKSDQLAPWLQIPYLIWVTFALYLNIGIWLLN